MKTYMQTLKHRKKPSPNRHERGHQQRWESYFVMHSRLVAGGMSSQDAAEFLVKTGRVR